MSSVEPHRDRLVWAVLAAQMAALRDRINTLSAVEQLWKASDNLSRLSDPSALDIGQGLETLAFKQAQSEDLVSQMADCLVAALQRLAAADALAPTDLLALYVCDDQRRVHDSITLRSDTEMP